MNDLSHEQQSNLISRLALLISYASLAINPSEIDELRSKINQSLTDSTDALLIRKTDRLTYRSGQEIVKYTTSRINVGSDFKIINDIHSYSQDTLPYFAIPYCLDFTPIQYTLKYQSFFDDIDEGCDLFGFTRIFDYEFNMAIPLHPATSMPGMSGNLSLVIQDNETGMVLGSQVFNTSDDEELKLTHFNFIFGPESTRDDILLDIANRAYRKLLQHGSIDELERFLSQLSFTGSEYPLRLMNENPMPGFFSRLLSKAYQHNFDRQNFFAEYEKLQRVETRVNPGDPSEVSIEIDYQYHPTLILKLMARSRQGGLSFFDDLEWVEVSEGKPRIIPHPDHVPLMAIKDIHSEAYLTAQSRFYQTGDLHFEYLQYPLAQSNTPSTSGETP